MDVKRMWFPTHGRLQRRVIKRREDGWVFRGCVPSGLFGLFLAQLVYERVEGGQQTTTLTEAAPATIA